MIESICNENNLHFISVSPVYGGDINESFEVNTREGKFFLKINDAGNYREMFEKEADGLMSLNKATSLKVPRVVGVGRMGNKQYLLLEWLQKGSIKVNTWNLLAEGLAELHKVTALQPGWHSDNYIGSLIQQNTNADSWAAFYEQRRITPLVISLYNKGSFSKHVVSDAEQFCKQLEGIFPREPFSLLLGDLWSGNFFITVDGMPAIFDPAVYFGHREMDLAMTKLFDGFDNRFYTRYHEIYPLEKDWHTRLPVTQLYPLLVHAVLFGGGYINKCRNIIKAWQ
jgi:fructosamine-3-kinase